MVKSIGVLLTAAVVGALAGSFFLKVPQPGEASFAWASHGAAASEAEPGKDATASGDGFVARNTDGHYWAWAEIDEHPVRVLIDTGATAVALTPSEAKKAGVELDHLVYDHPMNTAQGQTFAAAVTLESVSVAGARLEHVEAMIVPHGLSTSLLGMSYLGRLQGFEATRAGLTLHP